MALATSPKKAKQPLWFTPICDDLRLKIAVWKEAYWYGEVHSTRPFLAKDGHTIDKPTRCAHKIPIREVELDHLIRIIESLRPESHLLEELKQVKLIWRYGKPVQGYKYMQSYWSKVPLPAGMHRVITLAFYPEHVVEILGILNEAKTGQKAASLDQIIANRKKEGKDVFEQ